ncbi:acyltransferase family protein [Oharaeibacter diazotrophicus]|uniref:Peptidoglycan/LPS O-acetylase OafA/YrhL n=1 Tax=Oharaeibacter diazotrophicus TaxID=1920512 RepID=A0A4R6RE05_9HYPH|nr:acyltransferase [Oharaeibacter diazotrophicus]TDP84305.1 peptidoglycan/LPS O-acetylase OafA/YrhL [Oharaeibacter diazotrophicus]BBE73342.1 acyltransferase family protein [Pleomorphomonas sp. SM30]GLS75133.1 hypothetical protein GCM10007904_04680 [Oharaeibacter diazotrophicus]
MTDVSLTTRSGTDRSYAPFGAFRLALAALVMLQHVAAQLAPAAFLDAVAPYEFGSTAVLVFFVLSGYVIADATQLVYARRPVAFLANRAMRILPSYAVALAVFGLAAATTLALGGAVSADGTPLALADLADPRIWALNLAAALPGGERLAGDAPVPALIVVVWAVRIEMAFYVAWFALLLAARIARIDFDRLLTWAGVALLAASLVAFERTAGSTPAFVPFFVLGVTLQRLAGRSAAADRLVTLGLVAIATAAMALSTARIADLPPTIGDTGHFRDGPAQVALFGGLVILMFALATIRLPGRSAAAALDRRIGEQTYPLYLNHDTALMMVGAVLGAGVFASLLGAIAGLVLSVGVARLTEPVIGLARDRIRGRRLA